MIFRIGGQKGAISVADSSTCRSGTDTMEIQSVAYQSEVLGELSSSIETQNRGGLVGHDRLRPPHPSQVLHLGAHAQKGHMRSPRVISTDLAPLLPVWGWCLAR